MPVIKFELILESTRKLLKRGAINNISKMVNKMHPADSAGVIDLLSTEQEKRTVFELINNLQTQAEILGEVSHETAGVLLNEMEPGLAVKILGRLQDDDRADIVGSLSSENQNSILNLMAIEESEEVKDLLKHCEDSAGGIMTTNFLLISDDSTTSQAITSLQQAKEMEMVFYIYTKDCNDRLSGVLSLKNILIYPKDTLLSKIVNTDLIYVHTDTDQEEVAMQVARYNLLAIPVVDNNMGMVGIITVDDIIDVIKEETTEDMLKMVGTEEDITLNASPIRAVRFRLPWLFVNLFGGMISGLVLWIFRFTLQEVVAIATFIPVITAMGGNVGIQTSTIIIRGLATGKISVNDARTLLLREVKIGLIMGIVCGSTAGLIARLWHNNNTLGISVGVAMFCTITFATIIGILMPILFKKLKIDPAIAAGPLVTTMNDISGLIIYLNLSYAMLTMLH